LQKLRHLSTQLKAIHMTERKTAASENGSETDPQLSALLGEMQALFTILPLHPSQLTQELPSEDEVEAYFDNMPV
jgi:hypothetical protein